MALSRARSGSDARGSKHSWILQSLVSACADQRDRRYPLALTSAIDFRLPSGSDIRLVTAPVFIGTKFEAYASRGGGDLLASHDLEDVINVVDGRPTLLEEIAVAPTELQIY